jgi:hypothetical protein
MIFPRESEIQGRVQTPEKVITAVSGSRVLCWVVPRVQPEQEIYCRIFKVWVLQFILTSI